MEPWTWIKHSQALLVLVPMAWFPLRVEGISAAPSHRSACLLLPTGSLLRLFHHPDGAAVVYRGAAPGCHRPVPHLLLPPHGHHGRLRGEHSHPQEERLEGQGKSSLELWSQGH